jgi:hypothetical protein
MLIKLRCAPCGSYSTVSFEQLYSLWKQVWESLKGRKKKVDLPVTVQIKCLCGTTNHYDGPMFRHIFGIAFDEMMNNKDTV